MLVGLLEAFVRNEDGATAIEYGLIAALIAIAIVGTFVVLGDGLRGLFNNGTAEVLNTQAGKIN